MRVISTTATGALRRCCSRVTTHRMTRWASITSEPRGAADGPQEAAAARRDHAQRLFSIRNSSVGAADAMDIWAVTSGKLARWKAAGQSGTSFTWPPAGAREARSLSHIEKRPIDSLLTVVLPFGSDAALRKQFLNFRGHLRIGKLLEECDSFAGNVAYLHCDSGDDDVAPPTLVTASTDRVDLVSYPLPTDVDLQLTGMVTYVGASSLNVDIDLTTVPTQAGAATTFLQASLTFVARDRSNAAVGVPRLKCVTEAEVTLNTRGRLAQAARRKEREESLLKIPPTHSELAMVHDLFVELNQVARRDTHGQLRLPEPSQAGKRSMFLEETRKSSCIITMPQDRNIHGKVFGGFLMRHAFEIAWACGWNATGVVPKFLSVDQVTFLQPVEIGTLLTFDAQMNYADVSASGKTYNVSVTATMHVPSTTGAGPGAVVATGDARVTNTFHFTFYCDSPERMPRLLPRSYEDAMQYIDGYRRQRMGAALASARRVDGGVRPRFELTI